MLITFYQQQYQDNTRNIYIVLKTINQVSNMSEFEEPSPSEVKMESSSCHNNAHTNFILTFVIIRPSQLVLRQIRTTIITNLK